MSRHLSLVIGAMSLVSALSLSCAGSPSTSDRMTLNGPSPGDFEASIGGVEPVFERHCGSFDCHGNPARPLRIYGQNGLRIPNDAGILPGTATTTTDEISANYRSIIAVEPEQMNAVVKNGADPESLLILKKPLLVETHKGGLVLHKDDDSETCIKTWLQDKTDKGACTSAAQLP
jgi:hypothetical protein